MRTWILVCLVAVSTTAQGSTFSRILFGQDVERQHPVGSVVFDYDGQQDEKGILIPGGNLNTRLVIDDDIVKGVPYTFGYAPPASSSQADAVQATGLYKNSVVLEQVSVKDVERKREKKQGGLFSREYEIRDLVSGNYVFFVTSLPYGRNKPMMASCVVNVGRPNTVTTKVTRRVTEVALDKDGKEIDESSTPVKREKTDRQYHSTQSDQRTQRVSSGVVDIFGPAWMRVSTQIYNQSGHQIHDSGTGQEIGANGKLRISDIQPLPCVVVVHYWGAGEWKEAGRLSLTQEKWFDSLSLQVEDKTWLSEAEMNRYLDLVKRLDQKQGTAVEAISRQRIARGEWIYWIQKPQETTEADWRYLRSVTEPRRRQQLLEMLSLDVIHRGQGAFPYDKTLTAGWGYELAYQALTYMKPQWAIRDGAAFQKTFAPPLAPPATITEDREERTVRNPRTRVIVEEMEVEGYVSGAVQGRPLGQATTVRYHKPGLWDKVVTPLTSYVGRTRMSISTTSTGGSVGNVSSSSESQGGAGGAGGQGGQGGLGGAGGAGGSVGNIDVSAEADAAASAAADAAAASESN